MIRTTSAHLFLATEKDGSFQGVQNVAGIGRLLAAVMEALCHPAVKLTAIMPINCEPETEAVLRRQSLCMDDNTNSVARLAEGHRYPVLASQMSFRMEVGNDECMKLQFSGFFGVGELLCPSALCNIF